MNSNSIFLLLVSLIGLAFNLGAPELVSEGEWTYLFLEHFFVVFFSWYLIVKILRKENLSIKNRYYQLFMIGYIVALIVLHYVWTPKLDPSREDWGFDPTRYYYYASELLRNGDISYGLNYKGVVYFYLWVFKIFTLDPLVPLYINVLLSLTATLYIARWLGNAKTIKHFAWLLVIPEIIAFNMMSSREILCMASVSIFVVKYAELRKEVTKSNIFILSLAILFAVFIRPPMGVIAIFAVSLHMLFASGKKMARNIIISVLLGGIVFTGLYFSQSLGSQSNADSMQERVAQGMSGEGNLLSRSASRSGLTAMLIPHNPVEYFVFGVIRSVVYVIPPPDLIRNPAASFSFSDISVYVNLSTIFMFILALAVYRGIRKYSILDINQKILALVLIVFFFSVGITVTGVIQVRYRIVYDLFYFGFAICMKYSGLINKKKKRRFR